MDTGKLEVFKAVADQLHFGRAAETLHIAQPAVSRTVAQLETSLGVKLFDRNTRSVTLTPAGLQLQAKADGILSAVAAAERSVRDAVSGEAGRVVISFAGATTSGYMGALVRRVRERYPGIELDVLSHYRAALTIENLENHTRDFAFGRWDDFPHNLRSYVIETETLEVALPADHPLAGRERISFADLEGQPFVGLDSDSGSILRTRLRELTYAAGYEANIVQTAPNTDTILALVGAGVGLTLTLASVADRSVDAHVKFLPVSDPYTPVRLRLLWNPANANPVVPKILEVAREELPSEKG